MKLFGVFISGNTDAAAAAAAPPASASASAPAPPTSQLQGNVESHKSGSLPERNPSHTTREVNMSTAAEVEVRREERIVLSREKLSEDKPNVSEHINGPENIVSEASEPRRTRRSIQPTEMPLDERSTSFTSHKRGTSSKKRARSSKE